VATWATFEDVTSRWVGDDVPTDETLVEVLLGDAEQVILASFPGIQARIDSESIPVERVRLVVVSMVSRLLRNPEWVRSIQETVGPFSHSKTFMGDDSGLFLSERERGLLSPSNSRRAFEVDLGWDAGNPSELVWLDVSR
jgi:hypothetical protein